MSLQARYTILRKIADGGTAEIFLANQRGVHGFEKLVVLKRIFPAFYADPQFRNMLVDEARIAMSLNHSNIVQVLDLGEEEGQYILALELVDGWTLDAVIRRVRAARSTIPPALALHVVAEVCRALSYAHAKLDADGKPLGIVHRDISPHNVLLSEQGEVKLTDFGIATASNQREQGGERVIRGKLAYMSPEQASGLPLDARSDLFSVGTMLYVMACGRFPFDAPTDLELLLLVKSGRHVPPESARPGLHPELVRLLERLMAADVAARYQRADEVLADVEQIMRTAFKSVGQTELKRWLQDLSIRDGVPALTKASPVMATSQAGRVLGSGRDATIPSAAASSVATVPSRVPPPVPAAARAVSSGARPPPPSTAALAVGRRPTTSIAAVANTGGSGRVAASSSGAPTSGGVIVAAGTNVDDVEELTPEPYEPTPGPVVVAALEGASGAATPTPPKEDKAAAIAAAEAAAAAAEARERELEKTAPGETFLDHPVATRNPRPTPGPTQASLIALSSTATVPPPSKVVPPPPTGHSGLHAIPPPPVASDILKGLGSNPLLGTPFGRGAGAGNAEPATSTAFPGSVNTLPPPRSARRWLVIGGGLVGVLALVLSVRTCASGKRSEAFTAKAPPDPATQEATPRPKTAPQIEAIEAPKPNAAVAGPIAVAPVSDAAPAATEGQMGAAGSDAAGSSAGAPAEKPSSPATAATVDSVDAAPRGTTAVPLPDTAHPAAPPPGGGPPLNRALAAGAPPPDRPAPPLPPGAVPTVKAPEQGSPSGAPSPAPPATRAQEVPRVAIAEPRGSAPAPSSGAPPSEAPAAGAGSAKDDPAPGGEPATGEGGAGGQAQQDQQDQKVMVLVKSVPPGARVTTAHHDYGTTPVSIRLKTGTTYALTLKLDGFKPAKQRLVVTDDPEQEVTVTLKKGTGSTTGASPVATPAPVPAAPPAPTPPKPKEGEGPSWWQKMFKSR